MMVSAYGDDLALEINEPDHLYRGIDLALRCMLNRSWRKARMGAGLAHVRVHDLKHTFGRRLRASGVSFEDRQDLLGHRSGRITTHYSALDLSRLIEGAESVCEKDGRRPDLVVLRSASARASPAKVPHGSGILIRSPS
jgi:hypothetical protein